MKLKHTLVGIAFDVIDYLGLGFAPILGDIIDLFSGLYFFKVLGPLGLTSLIELIPLFDVLPTNIVLGIYADRKGGTK